MNVSLHYCTQLAARLALAGLLALGLLVSLGMLMPRSAYAAGETCFATINGSTVYSSTTASAVQSAVNAASAGQTVKVAGTCTGVQTVSGQTHTVYINKAITLIGGYANGSWNAVPDPVANPTVLDANSGGRVLYITTSGDATVENLILQKGSKDFGGAVWLDGQLTLQNSQIRDSVAEAGGAIYTNATIATLTIRQSSLVSNTATTYAGSAIYNSGNPILIEHSTLSYNSANGTNGDGGALFGSSSGKAVTVRYSTFSHNSTSGNGAGLYGDGNYTLFATIVANSLSGGDCAEYGAGIVDAGYNIIEGGGPCLSASTSHSGDPALGSLRINGAGTLSHALNPGSPATDAIPSGSCAATIDQRGINRPLGSGCDIGAYEFVSADSCAVSVNNSGVTHYANQDASALQTAVANATAGDTLKIAGTCAGVLETGGITQTVYINKNLTLQGGYTTNWTTSDPDTYPTTLDAQNSGRVVYIPNNNYRVTLDGLTMQNGSTTGDGGGIWTGDTLTVTNSIIRDNFAGDDGGGIYFGSGSVGYIAHTTIASNTLNTTSGTYFGAGLYSQVSAITIANSAIYSNTGQGGGGIYTYRDVMTISNSAIYGNRGTGQAGGINNQEGAVTLINSTLTQNSSPNGAGIFNFSTNVSLSATLVLSHSTVVNNSGNHGIRTRDSAGGATAKTILYSSIIANNGNTECNITGSAAQVDATNGYNIDSDGSCVTDGVDNNITADPLLLPLADNGGDTPTHALSPTSPARNTIPFGFNGCGLNNDADQRGVARAQESGCDSGAFEYEGSAPSAVSESYNLAEDVPLTIAAPGVLSNASNSDDDTLYASLSAGSSNGTLNLSNLGGFAYTPTLNFNGSDSFTYTVADGGLPVVGHWVFNEGRGTTAYDAGDSSLNGTLVGNATYSSTLPNGLAFANAYALDLDGVGDRVNIPDSNDINLTAHSQRTVSAWFRADDVSVSSRKQIIWDEGGQGAGLNIYLYNGALYAGAWASPSNWSGGNWLSTSAITSGQWHHVALVLDSDSTTGAEANSMFLYLDGALAQSGSAAQLAGHSANTGIGDVNEDSRFHNTGAYSGSGGHGFAGQIDDVRVMNAAATAFEVETLMVAWPGLGGGTGVASLSVTPVNDAPIATDNSYTLTEDTPQSGNVISDDTGVGTDSDIETVVLTATVATNVSHGTLSLASNGAFVYTPTLNYNGSDSFTYILSDGVLTDTALVSLTITAVNDAPVASDDSYTLDEDATAAGNVMSDDTGSGVDSDIDSASLSVVVDGDVSHGALSLASNGAFVYTPTLNYNGSDSFTYILSDGVLTDTAQVNLTITAVNDAPVAVADSYSMLSNDTLSEVAPGLLDNDSDTEGDGLTAALQFGPAHGAVLIAPDGAFVYTPTLDYIGADSFSYVASDGALTDTALVTIQVYTATIDLSQACGTTAELIEAIETAETLPFTTTIYLAANCTYTLTAAYDADPDGYGAVGLPPITTPLVLVGNGAALVRDEGANPFRFFYVTENGRLTLLQLELGNGYAQGGNGAKYTNTGGGGGGAAGLGGAIFNKGQLIIQQSTLINNQAIGGNGANSSVGARDGAGGGGGMGGDGVDRNGGGLNGGAAAQPTGQAGGEGGGGGGALYSGQNGGRGGFGGGGGAGSGNSGGTIGRRGGNGGFAGGGGGAGDIPTSSATAIGGTGGFAGGNGGNGAIANAGAGGGGGGLGGAIFNYGGSVTLENSTLYSNTVKGGVKGIGNGGGNGQGYGGGLFNQSGTMTLRYITLATNNAPDGGGGVYNYTGATLYVTGTIVADSTTTDCVNNSGAVTLSNSLLEAHSNCGAPLTGDPQLGALGDNGGDTATLPLNASSPALNVIAPGVDGCGSNTPVDQREMPRPQFGACDLGAYEYAFHSLTVGLDGTGSGTVSSSPAGIGCGGDCSENIDYGTVVTLTATPDTGSTFSGWSGACNGTGACALTITETKEVTATFNAPTCFVSVNDSGSTDYSGTNATVLQAAVNAANSDDTLKIAGTCSGVSATNGISQTVYLDKDLTLRGGYTTTNWLAVSDPDAYPTTLTANNLGRAVVITGTANVQVENLIVRDGTASAGGGLYVDTTAGLTLLNSQVLSNTSTSFALSDGGGGLGNLGTTVISRTTFSYNQADQAGAVGNGPTGKLTVNASTFSYNESGFGRAGAIGNIGWVTVTASSFVSNAASDAGAIGNASFSGSPGWMWLENSTFINNTVQGSNSSGGAIDNDGGELHVLTSTFRANIAGGGGGAIYNNSASSGVAPTLYISHTDFISNTAGSGGGGAIRHRAGTVSIDNSLFTGNQTTQDGGAIRTRSDAISLVVSHSTFAGNGAARNGGGIFNSSTLTVTNSTFSANAGLGGGGIYNAAASAALIHDTFSGNLADSGFALANLGGTVALTGTIVVGTDSSTCFTSGGTVTGTNSVIQAASTNCGFSDAVNGNIVGVDPLLGPLADNGGETQTHALLPGSPAVDAAGACGLATDQRGVSRPQGTACDTGAYEAAQYSLTVVTAGDGAGTVGSDPAGIDCGARCQGSFVAGAVVTLTATADGGAIFADWSGAVSGSTNPLTLTVSSNSEVTATFTALAVNVYPAQPGVAPNSSVTISAAVQPAQAGITVSFTVASGGGSLSSTTADTDPSGVAAVLYTASAVAEVVQIVGSLAAAPSIQDDAIVFVAAGTAAGATGPSASGVYTVGNLAPNHLQVVKLGAGAPIMGWAEYDGNPCPASTPGGQVVSPFVDVMVEDAAGVDAIVVTIRYTETTNAAPRLYWCNLGAWQQVGGTVSNDSMAQTLVFTIFGDTSPTILQLEGTPFVGVSTAPTAASVSWFAAEGQADRVRLTWQTLGELGLYGFHLYRGMDAVGPGDRITADPLPALGGGSLEGYEYTYDDLAPTTSPVFYWLEELRSDGAPVRHGPARVGESSRVFLPSISVAAPVNATAPIAVDVAEPKPVIDSVDTAPDAVAPDPQENSTIEDAASPDAAATPGIFLPLINR